MLTKKQGEKMADFSMQDQIDYLESYSKMLKSQADMIDVQIKFLKAGKDVQENIKKMQQMFPMFNMMDWTKFQQK